MSEGCREDCLLRLPVFLTANSARACSKPMLSSCSRSESVISTDAVDMAGRYGVAVRDAVRGGL